MTNNITQLNQIIQNLLNQKTPLRSVDKNLIQNIITDCIVSLDQFIETVESLTTEDLLALKKEYELRLLDKKKEGYIDIYATYLKNINAKSKSQENIRLFSSLTKTAMVFKTTLEYFDKNLDHIIENDELSFKNCKVSGLLLLTIIKASNIFSLYSTCLFTQYTRTGLKKVFDNPRYRNIYILEKSEFVGFFVNKATETTDFNVFVYEISMIMKKNKDLLIVNQQGLSFLNFAFPGTYSNTAMTMFKFAMPSLNIFAHIGNILDNIKHAAYLKNLKTLEWLKSHVAILKLDLNNIDPDDPRYQELVKIIEVYDAEITKLDNKILKYLES